MVPLQSLTPSVTTPAPIDLELCCKTCSPSLVLVRGFFVYGVSVSLGRRSTTSRSDLL